MRILYLPDQYAQQRQREKKRWIWPVRLAMQAEYYRQQGHEVAWEAPPADRKFDKVWPNKIIDKPEGLPFLSLPAPDRLFTDAMNPKYQQNGNYKYHPGTYMQVADGCWHGKCTFCVENKKEYQVRVVEDCVNEIFDCIHLGYREIFDDSGCFPTGKWLERFCFLVNARKVTLGCNMRMVDVDYKMMKRAGFRMVLFGLESANQKTLDCINKGVKVEDIKYIKKAAKVGLEPHVCAIFGHPNETDKDAENTLRVVWELLKNGHAKTAQASFYTVSGEKGNEAHRHYIQRIYGVAKSPRFWLNKLRDIHDIDDLKYFWRQIKEGIKNG